MSVLDTSYVAMRLGEVTPTHQPIFPASCDTQRETKEIPMRKIVVAEFVSLDGVMQAPGGVDEDTDGGCGHGGWTMPYWHDDIGAHFFQSMTEADALLLGRKTWQGHGAAFAPMP